MNTREEAHIIALVKAGDPEPFGELVSHYQDPLFRFISNMVGRHSAEDVVQETFLAAFRNVKRYDSRKAMFRTWLFRIARNQALNFMKKRKRDRNIPEPPMEAVPTPADELARKEIFLLLDRVLANLNFRNRTIFVLAELEGLSYAEIARIEGVRLGTVKSKLARTRAKLKIVIKEYLNHYEE